MLAKFRNIFICISASFIGLEAYAMQSAEENLWACEDNICLLVYQIQAHNMTALNEDNICTLNSLVLGCTIEEISSAWEEYTKCRILREGDVYGSEILDDIIALIFYNFDRPTLGLCLQVSLQWNRLAHQAYENQIRSYLIRVQWFNPEKFLFYRPIEHVKMMERSCKQREKFKKQLRESIEEYQALMAKRHTPNLTAQELLALFRQIQTQAPIFQNDINNHGTEFFISIIETTVLGDKNALNYLCNEIKTTYVDKQLPFSWRLFGVNINHEKLDPMLMKKFYEQIDFVIKKSPRIKIVKDFFEELFSATESELGQSNVQ